MTEAVEARAKIGALLPYFAASRTLSEQIVPMMFPEGLPRPEVYYEPFCGSFAVGFGVPASRRAKLEIANDVYGLLINLARVVASNHWSALTEQVERTIWHEDLIHQGINALSFVCQTLENGCEDLGELCPEELLQGSALHEVHVQMAYWLLVVEWIGRNGLAGTDFRKRTASVRYTNTGGNPATRWRSVGESLPAWHERLRDVVFTRRDALPVLEELRDEAGLVVYADPPYLAEGEKYLHGWARPRIETARGDLLWDASASEPLTKHKELAEILSRYTRARVFVSYKAHADLEWMYPTGMGWRCVRLRAKRSNGAIGERKDGDEVLLLNRPAFAALPEFMLGNLEVCG